jgi:hypothetical protein
MRGALRAFNGDGSFALVSEWGRMKRFFARRKQPKLAPQLPATPRPFLASQVERLVGASLTPIQLFLENLQSVRPWWPVLLPALALYFRHRYRIERRELAALAKRLADEVQQQNPPTS